MTESSYDVKAAKLVRSHMLTDFEKYFEIRLTNGQELGHVPGQFVMISVPGVGECPISVSSSPTKKGTFELVVRRVGSVTGALHELEPGALVGIRGPFGNGFPTVNLKNHDLLFIGGGCGNIPLHSLITYVLDNRGKFGKVSILLGCRSPELSLFDDEFDLWAQQPNVYLDRTVDQAGPGWKGKVGVITTLIPQAPIDPPTTFAVVVGPPVMYQFVIKELLYLGIPDDQIIVSLERHMKCAVGKCGRCQIVDHYCCQDGPVFTFSQIRDNCEALT